MRIKETTIPGKASLPGYTGMKRNNPFTKMNPSHTWSEGFDVETPELIYPGRGEEIANILYPGELENSTKGQNLR